MEVLPALGAAHRRAESHDRQGQPVHAPRSDAVCQAAAGAGAHTINVIDAGQVRPHEFGALLLTVRAALASFSRLSFSAQGPAVANTIAAVEAGADQAHVTMGQAGALAFTHPTPAH